MQIHTAKHTSELFKRTITALGLGLFAVGVLYCPNWLFILFVVLLFWYIAVFEWPLIFSYKKAAFWLILPVYPLLPMLLFTALRIQAGPAVTLFFCFCVACHDTMSFFIGKLAGKNKLCPAISPGKTWEGFIGGFISTLIIALVLLLPKGATFSSTLFFTSALCTLALAGDLFESLLKRSAGIKDSGFLLPGHGGVLDRIDSLLGAVFLAYGMQHFLSGLISG